ncbi:chaoptin-like [Anopheles ziemanni]|uniref:chaoptin-like n=1 Tax=Anopheles coustani TaxID=139045 RepID=UPI002658B4C7|nr:chaoptin-like [Anopheles coustani]XP_058178785.1 chaoptin-like [Anopheles ziemanni]
MHSDLVLAFLLCVFSISFCKAQCSNDDEFSCFIPKVNISAGGLVKLQAEMLSAPFRSYYIEKLIVVNPPSGAFLQRVALMVNQISFDVYHEPVMQLLSDNTLQSITLNRAQNLHGFVVDGTNDHMKELVIDHSLLDRVPSTLGKLRQLRLIQIRYSHIEMLSLEVLASNAELMYATFTNSRIARVLPLKNANTELKLREIDLSENLIEHLDMSSWAPFKALIRINLSHNRLLVLDTQHSFTLDNLTTLYLDSNHLKTIDMRHLTLPQLQTISLNDNNFTEVPSSWGKKEALSYISINNNYITSFDFGSLRSLTSLGTILLESNHIHSVTVSNPVVHLPQLKWIYLANNTLNRIDLNGTDFPQLSYLTLAHNQFTSVPTVFRKYPNLRLSVEVNPIKCDNFKAHHLHLESFQIISVYAWEDDRCPDLFITYGGYNYCCVG